MLSVVIPSYKDPLLHKTIDSIIESAEGEIEIIPILDGYWPETPVKTDHRIRVVHLGNNGGMRNAINSGILVSRGEYIMRTDEHCMFARGFDKEIIGSMQDNWIMTARRYFLDPIKWSVMEEKLPVDYEKLVVQSVGGKKKFTGLPWDRPDKKDVMIDETMAMQGSFWIMKRAWWDKAIGELQTEGYGPHYQDSHEMVFKTWKKGGKLMVNKNTWFAHKHFSFPRSHNYGSQGGDPNIQYCHDAWREYYEKEIKPKWKSAL